jgi:hypothetical protein
VRWLKILFPAALVILQTCGLPNPYYLAPPGVGNFPAGIGTIATFTSLGYPTGGLTTFTGFDVYYKFLAAAPTGNDINLGGGGIPGPGNLTTNGFFPICLSTDLPPSQRTTPAIANILPADAQMSFTITLNLATSTAATYSYTSPSTSTVISVNIGRDVPYGSYPFNSKEFAYNNSGFTPQPSPDYQSSDLDVSAIYSAASTSPNGAYVVLYALAYGYEAGTSVVEYSTPVYIGYIQILPFP